MKKLITTICLLLTTTPWAFAQVTLTAENKYAPTGFDQTLLLIGQDRRTIDLYVQEIGVKPAGVMVYTSIQKLSGLWKSFDNGAGAHHAAYLMKKYPNSTLQLGLYMVGVAEDVYLGKYDANIDKMGNWLKGLNRPVYLRIGYEFDNPENEYIPMQYRYAFRHIVNRLRALKADNVVFVWHSALHNIPQSPFEWYPGDEYVDWIAISFFGTDQFSRAVDMGNEALLKDKPFMIAEASPAGMYSLRGKMDWYKRFFALIEETDADAACYINSHWDLQKMWKHLKWGDSRVQEDPEIKAMWLEKIKQERFLHAEDIVY